MSVKDQDGGSLTRLVAIMRKLLAPGGCPWDREQTFNSIKKYVVEEAYEVVDGIDGLGPEGDRTQGPAESLGPDDRAVVELREELGDLLLQVVFVSELARSRGWFGPDDVVAHIQHVRDVAGIDHVGLGGDFDGVDALPDGVEGVDAYPRILAALMARGWTEADIRKLAGENVLRVMRAVEAVAAAKAAERPSLAAIEATGAPE